MRAWIATIVVVVVGAAAYGWFFLRDGEATAPGSTPRIMGLAGVGIRD